VTIEFTAHNIDLPDGTQTWKGPLLRETAAGRAVQRTLDLVFSQPEKRGLRIVDLGCLEGGATVEFARQGFDALGIEARKTNIEKCHYVAERLRLPNLHFVQDDVRNIQKYGIFDATFCSGLLYHLESPRAFLRTLGAITRRVLILHTHYATEPDPPNFRLSPMTRHEDRLGKWYEEWPEGLAPEKVEEKVWASVGNHRSFWMTKEHLLETMREAGFTTLYEQYDFLANIAEDPYIADNARSLFVGIK
jgi:SAM-dependent methyltransferase